MKERPILFSAPMVLAILTCAKCGHISAPFPCEKCGSTEFRKTQTRRVMKRNQPSERKGLFEWFPGGEKAGFHAVSDTPAFAVPSGWAAYWCPYGGPGDRLWVRESFQPLLADGFEGRPNYKNGERYQIGYCATDGIQEYYDQSTDSAFCSKITPSIFMPRWASRLTLAITEFRVEKVQEISNDDSRAEGVDASPHRGATCGFFETGFNQCFGCSFRMLWNQINGPRGFGWEKNPWVWALTFRRVAA